MRFRIDGLRIFRRDRKRRMDGSLIHLSEWLYRVHGATAFAMLGVIWLVQLLVYPGFRRISPQEWAAHHREHSTRISFVVVPLMLSELCAATLLALTEFSFATGAAAGCVAVAWISTFGIQVPLHGQLSRAHDRAAIERLVRSNWIRTAAWTAKAIVVWAA